MINLFKKNFSNKILSHTFILLMSFFISYLVFSSSSSKDKNITKAILVVHAPCNVLHYTGELYSLMEKLRKKSILINHRHSVQCEDFSLLKFDFIFKTIHIEYVKKELRNYVLFNLDNHEAIKTEIKEKIIHNKNLIKSLEIGLKIFDLEGIDYNRKERSSLGNNLNSSFENVLSISKNLNQLKYENRQLEKLLKLNGAKYDLNFLKIEKRKNLGSFDNIFIASFFLTALLYFLFYLFITIWPKFKSDFK